MSAVARPTVTFVLTSLLVHRATANSDDDDDESNEHLSYSVWIALGLFVILFLLFDLLRTRMWWVYEPRLHHDSYRARTPHAPGRSKWFRVAWLQKVFAYWSDEDFLLYAGVDGLAITYFLRFATDVCVFAGVIGCLALLPIFRTGDAVRNDIRFEDDDHHKWGGSQSFAEWTIQNIHCRRSTGETGVRAIETRRRLVTGEVLFPNCSNAKAQWRFLAVVFCAWIFTLRTLSKLASSFQRFVHLRHWYLTANLSRHAPAVEAQRAMTVLVERVPWRLRSQRDLRRRFDELCGAGAVHSCHVVIAGLGDLERLVAARDRAQDNLEDALSKRAMRVAFRRQDATKKLGDDETWRGDDETTSSQRAPWWARLKSQSSSSVVPHVEEDDPLEASGHAALYATAGGAVAKQRRQARTAAVERVNELALEQLRREESADEEGGIRPLAHVNCCCGPCACRNCRGGLVPERYYHESIPYFRERVSTLNERIAELHRQRATESRNWSRRRRLDRGPRTAWRGCFWRVDDDGGGASSDDEPVADGSTQSIRRTARRVDTAPTTLERVESSDQRRKSWDQHRRAELRKRVGSHHQSYLRQDSRHWLAVMATNPNKKGCGEIWRRTKNWVRRVLTQTLPTWAAVTYHGAVTVLKSFTPGCSYREKPFEPSATAFVTFTRPTAKVQAVGGLLAARPFPMEASPAPEPRDIIWTNISTDVESIARRRWLVSLALLLLLLSWGVIAAGCANAPDLLRKWGADPNTYYYELMASVLPVILLLSLLNLLPLIFQLIGRFYERTKAVSILDLSVVRRFFLFQFVNVYISVVSTAVISDFREAWRSPTKLLEQIAKGTPESSFYFAKLLVFQCGSSPLWLLRAWPFISRGWKTWTVQPPELPAMMYGWAYPKVVMAFTIAVTFWVFAPVLTCVAAVYFFLVNCAFRYLILYVHMPPYESGGEFYYLTVHRVLFGLGVSNVIVGFYMVVNRLYGHGLLMLPLPVICWGFASFCDKAYVEPSERMALNEAAAVERAGPEPEHLSRRFDEQLYRQPVLGDADIGDIVDRRRGPPGRPGFYSPDSEDGDEKAGESSDDDAEPVGARSKADARRVIVGGGGDCVVA